MPPTSLINTDFSLTHSFDELHIGPQNYINPVQLKRKNNLSLLDLLCRNIFHGTVEKEMFLQFSKLTMLSKDFKIKLLIAMQKANTLFTESFVKSFEYFLQDTRYAIHPSGFLKETIENVPSLSVSVIKDTNLSNVAKIIQLAQSLKSISFHMLTFTTEMLQALPSSIETLKFNSIDFENVKVSNEKFKSFQRLKEVEFGACSDEKDIIQGFSTVSSIEKISIRELGIASLDFLTQLQALRSLNIESCEQISPHSLTVLSKLSKLKSLKIDTCEKITDLQALAHLKINQLTLRHLDLKSDQSKHIASLTKLESLKLEHYKKQMQIPLQEFLSKLKKLKELTLENSRIESIDIEEVAYHEKLKKVSFYRSEMSVDDYTPLSYSKSLQELDIRETNTELLLKSNIITKIRRLRRLYLDKEVLENLPKDLKRNLPLVLSSTKHVASADISFQNIYQYIYQKNFFDKLLSQLEPLWKVPSYELASLTDQQLFKYVQIHSDIISFDISRSTASCVEFENLPDTFTLESLETIKLIHCKELEDRGLLALLKICPNIEHLDISETNVNCEKLGQLPKQLHSLKTIKIAHCKEFKDQGLLALLKMCPSIEDLDTTFSKVKCEELQKHSHTLELKSLKRINLSFCEDLTDEGLLALLEICPNIEQLDISETNVNCEKLEQLSKQLHSLKTINLSYCKNIKNQGLLALLKMCPSIEELNITKIKISDKELQELSHQLKSLKRINLSYCRNITDQGTLALSKRCPKLKELINTAGKLLNNEEIEDLRRQSDDSISSTSSSKQHLESLPSTYFGAENSNNSSLAPNKFTVEPFIDKPFADKILYTLDFSESQDINADILSSYGKYNPNLLVLNLKNCANLSAQIFFTLARLCPKLREIDMSLEKVTKDFSDNTVSLPSYTSQNTNHLLKLRKLNLANHAEVDDQLFADLIQLFCDESGNTQIEYINLSGCSLKSQSVELLCNKSENLKELYLSNGPFFGPKISLDNLLEIVQKQKNLEVLIADYNENSPKVEAITGFPLGNNNQALQEFLTEAICNELPPLLSELSLCNRTDLRINKKAFTALLTHQALQKLSLHALFLPDVKDFSNTPQSNIEELFIKSSSLTDKMLTYIIQCCPKLEKLTLSETTQISEDCLKMLSNCEKLQEIHLHNLEPLSEELIDILTDRCDVTEVR